MSVVLFQIQQIRKICRQQWLATDDLLATAASLREIAAEVDRTLANRLEAEAVATWEREQQAWERGDFT
jgi:hypothetical protein